MTAPTLDIRMAPLWQAVKARLNTSEARATMGGNRTFLSTDDYESMRGQETEAWGRQVVQPPTGMAGLFTDDVRADTHRSVPFNVLCQMNDYHGTGYTPHVALEQLQDLAYRQLHQWEPGVMGGKTLAVQMVVRVRRPETLPLWDDVQGMWYLSSSYRLEAAPYSM